MSVQIKAPTKAITKLMAKKGNKNVNPNTNDGEKGNGKRQCPQAQQLTKIWNMGGYCHSHCFHPVGANHDSKNCCWKTNKHKDNTTPNDCMGSSMYWLAAIHFAIEQQDHMMWKGKLDPTN